MVNLNINLSFIHRDADVSSSTGITDFFKTLSNLKELDFNMSKNSLTIFSNFEEIF